MSFAHETEATAYTGAAPAAQKALNQELQERMEEFLELDRFTLVIQPVVNFRNNAVKDGEALSRLEHPERGVIFPDEFLPVIDALGLYPAFDRYIFEKSCVWLRRSMAEGNEFDILSCNFSRKTLSEADIVQDMIDIADGYGVSHGQMGVEITEREPATDEGQLVKNLNLLKEAGFRIILDDYGSGVAADDDLARYPVDILKIDRSLLWKATTEEEQNGFRAMVKRFLDMGAEVVCEGIETEEQNRLARESGCHYGQGFLFFKPLSQDQFFEMMRKASLPDGDL